MRSINISQHQPTGPHSAGAVRLIRIWSMQNYDPYWMSIMCININIYSEVCTKLCAEGCVNLHDTNSLLQRILHYVVKSCERHCVFVFPANISQIEIRIVLVKSTHQNE